MRTKKDESLSSKIHGIGSAIGFTFLLFVPLLLGLAALPYDKVTAIVSFVCFTLAFLSFAFFIMGEKEKFAKTVLRFGGLWQRITLVVCYIPLIFCAVVALI